MTPMSEESRLAVLLDGRALPDEEARAIWVRFSLWMDEHRGDFDGFAKQEGYVAARPETRGGKAVLVLSTKALPAGAGAGAGVGGRGRGKGKGRAQGQGQGQGRGSGRGSKKGGR